MTIYGGHFDTDFKKKEIIELEDVMNTPDFWNDKNKSEEVIQKLNNLRFGVNKIEEVKVKIYDALEMIEALKLDFNDEIKDILVMEVDTIFKDLKNLEVDLLLNGEFDSNDAILEIHPGAGGTESCDWASMLYRMYLRWCASKNYKVEVIDEQDGEEAGIKSVSIIVRGLNAYGYLKNEKGVHRLIRISPFDSGARRHTSFASVDITPIMDMNNIEVVIKDEDIKIDVYRSSGKGGQGVNTTDSAVRITHLPTKIVVTCQNERSQIQNKETAMNVLKNKLYQLEFQKKADELASIKGTHSDINFGSQIRTYTMHPYSLVKDHRTNVEDSNVNKIMDGDLDMFINANLRGVKDGNI